MSTPKKKIDVPIKDRYLLTYYEAATYFGIGSTVFGRSARTLPAALLSPPEKRKLW